MGCWACVLWLGSWTRRETQKTQRDCKEAMGALNPKPLHGLTKKFWVDWSEKLSCVMCCGSPFSKFRAYPDPSTKPYQT